MVPDIVLESRELISSVLAMTGVVSEIEILTGNNNETELKCKVDTVLIMDTENSQIDAEVVESCSTK